MSDDRIFTDRDCVEIGSGCSLKGKVVVLKESALEAGFVRPLYYCTGGNGANANALGKPVFLVNLKNGEFERCARDHVLGVLKPELLPDEEKLQLSQIRPLDALPLEKHEPQYSGYSFLEDGRYAAGVWLCNEKEAMEYVEMQKLYQHRIMLCDRNDFCVWEVRDGRQVHPNKEKYEGIQSAHRMNQPGGKNKLEQEEGGTAFSQGMSP